MTLQSTDFEHLRDGVVVDAKGDKVGRIADIYLDRDTQKPEWVLVNTGMFGTKETFVPLAEATYEGAETLRVPYERAFVKEAPRAEPDGELSEDEEAALYQYYGLQYSEAPSSAGRDVSGPTTDDAMTRSEEELSVETVKRPSELVRLKKYIVTDTEQVTVPVQREEVRVEREPITEANLDKAMAGPELSSEEHEATLYEEQVDVQKKVVPKERVRLDKDVVTEERTVSEEVRKEQIDVERDGRRGR